MVCTESVEIWPLYKNLDLLLITVRPATFYTHTDLYVTDYSCVWEKQMIILITSIYINTDEKVDLGDSKWEDIHVTTGALKMFFRELPEPLFPFAFFNNFISAISEWRSIFNTGV